MPTLIEVLVDTSIESNEQFSLQRPSFQKNETFLNASTGLLDETVLGDENFLPSQRRHFDGSYNDETRLDSDSDIGVTRLDGDSDSEVTRLGDITNRNNASHLVNGVDLKDDVPPLESEKLQAAVRTTGTEEDHYKRRFEHYVSNVVTDFRRHNPDKIKDYRSLSRSEKETEQKRIAALLTRLGMSTSTVVHCRARVNPDARVELAETSADSTATRLGLDYSDADLSHRNNFDEPVQVNNSSSMLEKVCVAEQESHESSVLLSPGADVDELAARMDQSMALMSPCSNISSPPRALQPPLTDDSSASSVELVRKNNSVLSSPSSHMYESPNVTTSRSKRLASASGKRGTDNFRMRMGDDSFISFDASIARASKMISSPLQRLSCSAQSPESPLFNASQSPICDNDSIGWEDGSVESETQRRGICNDRSLNDTLNSVDCTLNYRHRVQWHENSFLQEIPANVQLKAGAPFRMRPLRVGRPQLRSGGKLDRRRRISLVAMPDPLRSYERTLRKTVKGVYSWMKDKDALSEGEDAVGGILFSMNMKQIIDVTLKLIIKHPSNHNTKDMIDDIVNGGTLIVARSKNALEEWQSSLREYTSFSVLNHATMTVEERKRASIASRCAGYDIVVTTFDAIKSKDIAIPLDSDGHVILEKIGFQDGWYSTRSGGSGEASGRCEQLSVLHQITWRRVVFVDELGRKSYLAKMGTARAVASVALSSSSR
jgi:hypothetical protein